ncbi:MAG: hypothetical protein AAGC57_21310 [Pseudomonadota bacterium]
MAGPTVAGTGSPTTNLPYRRTGGPDFDGDGIADSVLADGGGEFADQAGGTIFLSSPTAYVDQNQLLSIAAENLPDCALATPEEATFFGADAAFAGDVLGSAGDELLELAAGTVDLVGQVTDSGPVLFCLGAPAASLNDEMVSFIAGETQVIDALDGDFDTFGNALSAATPGLLLSIAPGF